MRRVAMFVAAALSVLTANCTCTASHQSESDAGAIDAGPDVLADVRVDVNCADPVNWAAAPEREGYFGVGGEACSPPQYPLSGVFLGAGLLAAERTEIRSSCWRVEEAPDDSGWEVGQTFSGSATGTRALLRGFDGPVVFSGRLYRADGTLAYSVAPIEAALHDAEFLDVGTEEVVALMRPDAWATRFAIHSTDEVVATQEVIAGSGGWGYFNTLHREGDEFLARIWRLDPGLVSVDVPLGAGERAILAQGGGAAAVDETLLLFGNTSISRRLTLPEPPLGLAKRYHYVVVRFRDSLRVIFRDVESESFTIPVPPDPTARLVETHADGAVAYYASGVYWTVDTASHELRPTVEPPGAPGAEETGAPLYIHEDTAITENGFQALSRVNAPAPGPQFAGIRSVVGGSRIVHATARANTGLRREAAYLVQFDDGHQRIYHAPFSSFCE